MFELEKILDSIKDYDPELEKYKLCTTIVLRAYEEKMCSDNKVHLDQESNLYTFYCPHCCVWTEVPTDKVNCHIFRHGSYFEIKDKDIKILDQIDPHASKEVCDMLVKENRILGCGKPFKFVRNGEGYIVEICDYI